jgi:uncharacterized protein
MTTSYVAPLGAPTWLDLATSDLARAREFYAAVFGWTYEVAGNEYGGYVTAFVDGKPVAGLMANRPEAGTPDRWSTYLHTADVDASIAKVHAAGGSTCLEPMDIPATGRMAFVIDTAGAVFGLWQPGGHPGFEIVGAAGSPVWHQLTTMDFPATLDFYRDVFGWDYRVESDTPEFRYSNAIFDGEPLVGVMDGAIFLPADTQATWTVFLGAADVDKALQTVVDNGGAVARAAEDTPYGRLAAVTDPTGAAFNLSSLQ